ncbi:MAG: ATP-dependent DNA helicase RecQ [Candidatus Sericytochromatia bacterium]|nr:ATP-dependent DNA helicase RecQ [Candidatus Sericytochromatia bacterium]
MTSFELPPEAEQVLGSHFGLDAFREGQREVIAALLAGHSALAVMPTGRGKSLCYQLPALMLPGLTLVVSPLIALMKDQVDALRARGIAATYINSTLDRDLQTERLEGLRRGAYRIVYVAPERFRQTAFVDALREVEVSLFAVDEAHCLSQWGHDFRPDYLKLRAALAHCGQPLVLATTATATPEVREDIVKQLGLRDPHVVVSGFDRPNLRYVVRHTPSDEAKLEKLLEVLHHVQGPGIVYAATRKHVEMVSEHLCAQGLAAVAYHAGLDDDARAQAQDAFMADAARLVVATNAFGMGIDKPDVRLVVHYDLPGTLEAYYQEAGRAGRDGRPAYCVLLFSPADRYLQEFFIEGACPSLAIVEGVYRVLRDRDEPLIFLSHEAINRLLPIRAHDMAIGTALTWLERAGLIERQARGTAVSEIQVLRPGLPASRSLVQQRVLAALLAKPGHASGLSLDLATFSRELDETREALHHALLALRQKGVIAYQPSARTRGIRLVERVERPLSRLDASYIVSKQQREMERLERVVAFAYATRCRRNVILEYFGETIRGACGRCDACSGKLDANMQAADGSPSSRSRGPVSRRRELAEGHAEVGDLYHLLSGLRSQLATEHAVEHYKIFTNETLRELAQASPVSLEAMLTVRGIGPEKLARYGNAFLGTILAYRRQQAESGRALSATPR